MALAEHEVLPLAQQIKNMLDLLDEVAAESLPNLTDAIVRNKRYVYSKLPYLAISKIQVSEVSQEEIIPSTDVPKRTLEVLDQPKQGEIKTLAKRIIELGFDPARVANWEYKRTMVLEGLAEKHREIFEREYARIRQFQKESRFIEDENQVIEITAMVTFVLAKS